MEPHIYILLYLIFVLFRFAHCSNCSIATSLICRKQSNCKDCFRAHSCCNWYYIPGKSNESYCALNESSQYSYKEENQKTAIISTKSLRKQITPQFYKVVLRKDEPLRLKITYQAEKDYPLELYYLTDLSYSMRNYVERLKELGDELGNSLSNLTKNYKIAFGSFLDKPGMPFILTDDNNRANPCRWDRLVCNPTYLFKHTLNFTNKIHQFFQAVEGAQISANLDDPDGALDAIQQILLCNETVGWTEESRKFIVLSTDSPLHSAGDGLLVGATMRNPGICLINRFGEHEAPLTYDYPSIAEIRSLLRQYKVNLIVAVSTEKSPFYERLKDSTLQKEMYVGYLNDNTSNILGLVSNGFLEFIKQVEFSTDTSEIPELDVKFFSDCNTGTARETHVCQNIEPYEKIEFDVELTLKEWIDNASDRRITIREKNINEDLNIDITFADMCKCNKIDDTSFKSACKNGVVSCDRCVCNKGWKGDTCTDECVDSIDGCIQNNESTFCSGRGNCVCGECECQEPYVGNYCEFECPVDENGKVCGGHGHCNDGVCNCELDYSGHDCSCNKLTDRCKFGSDIICHGNGECECNKCNCNTGYSGTYCERFKDTNVFCNDIEDIVRDVAQQNQKTITTTVSGNNVTLIFKNEAYIQCSQECMYITQSNNKRCYMEYCYDKGNRNTIIIKLKPENKVECSYTAQAMSTLLGLIIFSAIIGGGLVLIALKKWKIYQLEKQEYAEYEEMLMKEKREDNPLYNSPFRKYSVPNL